MTYSILQIVKTAIIFSEESACLNPIKRGFLVAAFAKQPSQCLFYCRESIRSTDNRKANNRKL